MRAFVAHVVVVVVIVEVLDAMTDATMVGIVAVEDMTTIAAHLHLTIDVMITDEDLDLDPTHHVSYDFYQDKTHAGWVLCQYKNNRRQVEQHKEKQRTINCLLVPRVISPISGRY